MNYLGIDIAKGKFDVTLLCEKKEKHKVFKNNLDGFERLIEWLKSHDVSYVHSCMEATGRYGFQLAKYLNKQGFVVSIVNPACIKAFAQSQLRRVKTDKVDSLLIAKFCRFNEPSAWIPPSDELEELVELTRRVDHLTKLKQAESNHRWSGITSKAALDSADKMIFETDPV